MVTNKRGDVALRGAQVEALDSISGWAALTDERGEFILPDLIWYPGARYRLIITANDYEARQLEVSLPARYPATGSVNLGELDSDRGCRIDSASLLGRNSISNVDYDGRNAEFYGRLFSDLTEISQTDEEKLDAINRYVATKLIRADADDNQESRLYLNYDAPRQVIERGTRYCGKLTLAFASIAEAGDYKTRLINLIDSGPQPTAHMVAEVYYGDRWHLYDPTAGVAFKKDGRVASHKELRLDTRQVSVGVPKHLPEAIEVGDDRLAGILRSGIHHYYYIDKR
jgi:hypothetical protein